MKLVRMDFVTSEDVQPLITVQKIPDCPMVERQFRLFQFGFVHWLNTEDCHLTKREKEILTRFRLTGFDLRAPFLQSRNTNRTNSELISIGNKLNRHYSDYQKWLLKHVESRSSFIYMHPKHPRFIVLNLPLERLTLSKRIKRTIAKKFRSLHELLLTCTTGKLRKLFPRESDYQELYRFACLFGFGDLIKVNVR